MSNREVCGWPVNAAISALNRRKDADIAAFTGMLCTGGYYQTTIINNFLRISNCNVFRALLI